MQISTFNCKPIESLNIKVDNCEIKEVTNTQFLGLTIDNHLSWDLHVNKVAKKVTSGLFALNKMSRLCNTNTLKIIYFAYIHSNISFGISIYGATSKKNLDRLLTMQKRAIRVILNLKCRESVKHHFKDLDIMTVYSLYIYEVINFTIQHNNHITNVGECHNYNLRNLGNIVIPAHKLKFFEKKTSFAGSKFFNYLPEYIKKERNNIVKFKKLTKSFFVATPLYSIDEYFAISRQ